MSTILSLGLAVEMVHVRLGPLALIVANSASVSFALSLGNDFYISAKLLRTKPANTLFNLGTKLSCATTIPLIISVLGNCSP